MTPKSPSPPARRPGTTERLVEAAFGAPAPVRALAARWAARRGLHAHALAVAPEDGYVLARAGFFEQAAELSKPGSAAWLGAVAGLGRLDLLAEAEGKLDDADRRWIAGLAAGWDPRAALEVLSPAMRLERAAVQLRLGNSEGADSVLGVRTASAEDWLISAALPRGAGDPSTARNDIDDAFFSAGLAMPFEGGGNAAPPVLADFKPKVASSSVPGPRVSVIVAAKDAAATLPMALASLTAQSWSNLDIIVVDDSSLDGTAEAVRTAARADGRIRLTTNSGKPGAANARNAGLALADGRFVTFHDADDWAHPRRIEHQVRAVRERRAVGAVSKHFRLTADGRPVSPRAFPMIRLCPISVLVWTEAARAAGPIEDEPVGTDSEYLARLDLLYGRPQIVRLNKTHIVAGWAGTSLSGADATGLASADGRALREAYERDWRVRHAGRLREMVG